LKNHPQREREREIMLFIGKPKGRSRMISRTTPKMDQFWGWFFREVLFLPVLD